MHTNKTISEIEYAINNISDVVSRNLAIKALKTLKKMSEDFDRNFGDDTDEQETLHYYLEMFSKL